MAEFDPQAEPFVCPSCFMASHNRDDKKEGYCGHCHDWTGVPEGAGADCD